MHIDTDKIFQSKFLRGLIFGIAIFIILFFVFSLGVFVGTKKADFSFRWADEYHRNFAGPQGGFFGDFIGIDREFTSSNGAFGQVIKISDGSITVQGGDNIEKIILVSDKTSVVSPKKNIKLSDLKVGDSIVVIGEPNASGQIQAELIRFMPTPLNAPEPNIPTTTSN